MTPLKFLHINHIKGLYDTQVKSGPIKMGKQLFGLKENGGIFIIVMVSASQENVSQREVLLSKWGLDWGTQMGQCSEGLNLIRDHLKSKHTIGVLFGH